MKYLQEMNRYLFQIEDKIFVQQLDVLLHYNDRKNVMAILQFLLDQKMMDKYEHFSLGQLLPHRTGSK